ncbi:MAG: imidazole glycerol phosphate synthase subunit HisH [Arenicellales bacterium]
MNRIAVIDLGTGNLRSVARALEAAAGEGCEVRVSAAAPDVLRADRVVFPGQSAIGSVMDRLRGDPALLQALLRALEAKPFLGICIGLQALYAHSSEDDGVQGLDILGGDVRHFLEAGGTDGALIDPVSGRRLKIPHMGWNTVLQNSEQKGDQEGGGKDGQAGGHPLWRGIPQDAWFYFVHSYCAIADEPGEVYGTTRYGVNFAAAAGRANVFAVQFHPEKSQRNGLALLGNFIRWDGAS